MTKKIPVLILLAMFWISVANAQNALNGEWKLVALMDEKKNEVTLPAKEVIVDINGQGSAGRSATVSAARFRSIEKRSNSVR